MIYHIGNKYKFRYIKDVIIENELFSLIANENGNRHIISRIYLPDNLYYNTFFIAEITGKDCSGRLKIKFISNL